MVLVLLRRRLNFQVLSQGVNLWVCQRFPLVDKKQRRMLLTWTFRNYFNLVELDLELEAEHGTLQHSQHRLLTDYKDAKPLVSTRLIFLRFGLPCYKGSRSRTVQRGTPRAVLPRSDVPCVFRTLSRSSLVQVALARPSGSMLCNIRRRRGGGALVFLGW